MVAFVLIWSTQQVVFNGGQSLLNTVTTGIPHPRSRSASTRLTNGSLQTDSKRILTRLSSSGSARVSSFRRSGLIPFNLEATMSSSKTSVGNLGVSLDSHMSMKAHVQRTCRTCYYQLRQLRSVRQSLFFTACTSVVHAVITSRLEYCNSLLAGISVGLMSQLQSVIRIAARLVMRKRKFDPISHDIRDRLHWLPVKQRINFKLGLLVYKCLHREAPSYLAEMLEHKSDNPALYRLRNTANRGPGKLVVPRSSLKTFGPRSFAMTGPSLWNSLQTEVTDETLNISTFKIRLKTFIFKQSFPDE